MKKVFKKIAIIFISFIILSAILIPIINGSSFGKVEEKSILDTTWYYESIDGTKEVVIPSKLDIEANETCTIYAYLKPAELSSYTIVMRTSYQKLDIYLDDVNIYSYDTDSYRPYGKADPSKVHYITLPDDIEGKKISISVTSPYSSYSGYFSSIEIGDYDDLTTSLYAKHYVEFIFGIFIVLLSLFLLITNIIVMKINDGTKSIFYIFGASFFLGLWMLFDSKLINILMNDFLVGQFVYISLHSFAILFSLFINTKRTKYTKFVTISLILLAIINMLAQNILHIMNIIDYVEMLFISLGLIFIEILTFFINKLIRNHLKEKTTFSDKFETVVTALLIVFFALDVYLLSYRFTNINVVLGIAFTLLAITTHDKAIFQLSETAQASKELKARLKQTQNYLIQSQMKPHFIFNTLGAIRTMIKSSPDKAYKLTTSFSKYLRANINNISPNETISFASEVDHIKTYVDIEKERFGERLTVLYDIKCDNFNMPPLTVEPLVENAVKHGVCKKIKGGIVKISSWEEEDRYIVTVEDNGVGFNIETLENKNNSVGIKYIKLRLKEISNADFNIESQKGVGTKATLTFFKESEEKS